MNDVLAEDDSHVSQVKDAGTSLAENKFLERHYRIRKRAYELYEQRGRVDGLALDDWLLAETEILGAQKQQKVKAANGSH